MKGFASASERVLLNRELADLARQFNDVPGLFRSQLRLIIDACELNDRPMLDEAVEACEQIARQINLPHYSWRVASVQALQAIIEGDFTSAMSLLEQSQELAKQVDDNSALLTLPLQRMLIACDWNASATPNHDEIQSRLNSVYRLFPDVEVYVQPFQACAAHAVGQSGLSAGWDQAFIEKMIATSDHFTLCKLGELAVYKSDTELAQRVYRFLLPVKSQGTTMGLMGSNWGGPVSQTLGLIATFLGKIDEAWEYLENALLICTRMRSGPITARVHALMAIVAGQRGDNENALKHDKEARLLCEKLELRDPDFSMLLVTKQVGPARRSDKSPANTRGFTMQRQGDIWQVSYQAESTMIKHSKGMEILATLVAEPDREILALDLVSPAAPAKQADKGDSGPMLDEQSRAEYKQRVTALREELEDAETLADIGKAETLREELDFISRELSRAFGLGGRRRASGSAAERARVNAQRRLRDAIGRIEAQLPDAGRYLTNTIKTGRYCSYSPM